HLVRDVLQGATSAWCPLHHLDSVLDRLWSGRVVLGRFAGSSTCPIECGDTGHTHDIDSARPGVLAWRSALQGEVDPHLHRPGAHCSADASPVAELLHLPAGQLNAQVERLVQVDSVEPDVGGMSV